MYAAEYQVKNKIFLKTAQADLVTPGATVNDLVQSIQMLLKEPEIPAVIIENIHITLAKLYRETASK